jgi:uncharacterized protein (TIGR00299 family) protein
MTKRTLYLESFAGIAGDMFTAAFIDAGLVSPEEIQAVPGLLGVPEVKVEIGSADLAKARFTKVRVVPPGEGGEDHHLHLGKGRHRHAHGGLDHGDHDHEPPGKEGHDHPGRGAHHHYHYSALVKQLENSGLEPVARDFALRVFALLAEAEADSHGVSVEKVAFHEVGAVDSVVDVAMAGVCVAAVKPDRVLASPVKLGRGTIQIQHGTYPVPPPASARLAMGMPVAPVPEAITRPNVELSTPTGLAILRALDPEFVEGWPPGKLVAQGSGAGTTDLGNYPNVFRVALMEERSGTGTGDAGEASPEDVATPNPSYESDLVVEIRCNVDDQTAERTAWLTEKALELGALDAWISPLIGKKGRPAHCIVLLVKPAEVPLFSDFLLRHSSSFGVRYSTWNRFKLTREEEVRETPAGPVSFKIGRTANGDRVKEKPEFEDLKKIWEEDPDFMP